METEEYARAIGKILLDLRSLEFALRHFLYATGSTSPAPSSLSVGQVLPSSPLTQHDTLGQLIDKYNRAVAAAKQGALALDPALSELGDALIDGRIWGNDPQPPVRMVKFSAPSNGLVSCTFDALIDEAWLEAQERRLGEAYAHVVEAGEEIQPDWWTPVAAGARG